MANQELFSPDAVFVTSKATCNTVLEKIYQLLSAQNYVQGDFLNHLINREHNFPTGLNLATLSSDLPNIAVPHTEGKFVTKRLIVPVSLKEPVIFHNMVKPQEQLKVNFLFMLLETDPDGQALLLSKVMDFLARTDPDKLKTLFNCHDQEKIYQFLVNNFN